MDTKHFDLTRDVPQTATPAALQQFVVRGLDAYAISNAYLYRNGQLNPVDDHNPRIVGSTLECRDFQLVYGDDLRLVVYHNGIRNYSLLFPAVQAVDQQRAERMGKYYLEAEGCFEKGAWLSFMLMSAAIFEHLLFFKMGCNPGRATLFDLNSDALQSGIITQAAHDVIDSTRRARNVIHCNRLNDSYITRADALDAKTLIDELIARF